MRFLTFSAAIAALASLALAAGGYGDDSGDSGNYNQDTTLSGQQQGAYGQQQGAYGQQQGTYGQQQGVYGQQQGAYGQQQGAYGQQQGAYGQQQGSYGQQGAYGGVQVGGAYGGVQVGGGYSGVGNFQESGGYGYEVIEQVKIKMRVEIRESFEIVRFRYPPLCIRVRSNMSRFGAGLKSFFRKVGGFFRRIGHALHVLAHKIKVGVKKMVRKVVHGVEVVTEDVFEGVSDAFNCFASALHVQFRKCKSDWERVRLWSSCEIIHFKHWYEYRKLVREGKRRIYTRYQHDMLLAMEKFELSMKAEYQARERECATVVDVYSEVDIVYMETVGYEGFKAPYGDDL